MSITDLTQHVQYIVDERGNRKAAVLDISTWQDVLATLEDLEDTLDAAEARRALEPAISLEDYAARRAARTE
jgi:hypothetical protein